MKIKLRNLKRFSLFLSFLWIVLMPCAVGAESIIELESGNTFKGNLVREEGDLYFFDISGTEVSLKKSLVRSITEEKQKKTDEEIFPEGKDAEEGRDEGKADQERLGSIAGNILLPDVQDKGNLYIWFVPLDKKGKKDLLRKYYQVIDIKDIDSKQVPFWVKDVPAGEYKGFVNWDIASPRWKKSWGEGNFLSLPGDYAGITKGKITVTAGEMIKDVSLECVFFLKLMETAGGLEPIKEK